MYSLYCIGIPVSRSIKSCRKSTPWIYCIIYGCIPTYCAREIRQMQLRCCCITKLLSTANYIMCTRFRQWHGKLRITFLVLYRRSRTTPENLAFSLTLPSSPESSVRQFGTLGDASSKRSVLSEYN